MTSSAPQPSREPNDRVGSDGRPSRAESPSKKPLLGFLLCGMIMSLPAAVLPAWGYHFIAEYSRIGNFFLAMSAGLVLSMFLGRKLLARRGSSFAMATAAVIAVVASLFLSSMPSASADIWRGIGIAALGLAAGLLNAATFDAGSSLYRQDRAATVNVAGILFGAGCLITAVVTAMTLNSVGPSATLFVVAAMAGVCVSIFSRSAPAILHHPLPPRKAVQSFKDPSTIVFALLLFFQFGNEWAVAGWLAVFLIHRLGISPVTSLVVLAVYWMALLLGRIGAQWLFGQMKHRRVLVGTAFGAAAGCTMLAATDNLFGIILGVLLVASSFASIHPLAIERFGAHFPRYQPDLFNAIFTFAMIGGMLAPWTLGYFAQLIGVGAMLLLPLMGTCAVLALLVVVWLEERYSAGKIA